MASGTPPAPAELVRFVARFDRGEYWLAHEELEELWQTDRRDLYKGLIQIAAAFVHIERENWNGARRLLETALRYIHGDPDPAAGFDLEEVCSRAGAALERVRALQGGAGGGFEPALRFRLAPSFAVAVPVDAVREVGLPYRVRRHREADRADRAGEPTSSPGGG